MSVSWCGMHTPVRVLSVCVCCAAVGVSALSSPNSANLKGVVRVSVDRDMLH